MRRKMPLPSGEPAPIQRRSPRIEVMGQLHGQLVPMNLPLDVKDLSAGGFAVESTVNFPIGAVHRFRFITRTGAQVLVRATARHCRQVETADGTARYIAGFSFILDAGGETEAAIELMLKAAATAVVLH